jgi:signal transduction histidine kinase
VADNGPGIARETMPKVFDAFFTTKGIGGTGLGLWISQEIIQRHQGKLSVRSSQDTRNHGTIFTAFLPFDAAVR